MFNYVDTLVQLIVILVVLSAGKSIISLIRRSKTE